MIGANRLGFGGPSSVCLAMSIGFWWSSEQEPPVPFVFGAILMYLRI